MTRILAVLAMLAMSVTAAQAHTHSVAHYRHHYRYTPVMHLDVPTNRGWVDIAAIAPYPYPSQERSQAAVSMPSGHYSEPTRHYYASSGGLSAACQEARREGGPCGCHSAEVLLGTSEHVWHGINVWLADGWLAFRHVSRPEPGDAAIWVHRHVAPIVAVDGDTVTVADYFGTHTVRMAGLVFVDPRSR